MTRIAIAQMNSQSDIEANLTTVESLLKQHQQNNGELIVFPENFLCFAANKQVETAQRFEELQSRLEQLANQYNTWIVAGTLPCPFRPNGDTIPDRRVRTVSLCISPEKTEARYDKIHLFDVDVADGIGRYQESIFFEAGTEAVIAKTPFGNIGLMVCYDLRFPELALTLRKHNADLLTAPSAFTFHTGQLHWQLLLQARAMDTQCYVLGSAQQGTHGKRTTWGHSAATAPNGQLLAMRTDDGAGLIFIDTNSTEQQNIRQAMPLIQHRRLTQFKNLSAII